MSDNDYRSPHDEGYAAGYDDLLDECPYVEGTAEYTEWWEGYGEGSDNS